MPDQVAQSIRWFESLFLDTQELEAVSTERLDNNTVKLDIDDTEQNYSHVEVGNRHVCVDTSLGELKYKKVGNIYTWTDDNDVYPSAKIQVREQRREQQFQVQSSNLETEFPVQK